MSRTMLLVHGAFCGGWYWADFARHFEARGWRCLAPDLPHHQPGAAPAALAASGLAAFTEDIARRIAELPEPPVLVGHSMGGLICQKLAARGLARALVLLAPSAPWGIFPASRDEIEARLGLLSVHAFWEKALWPRFDIAARTSLDRLAPAARTAVFDRLVPESGRALFELLFWHLDNSRASAVPARDIACPVLCAVGSHDRVVSPGTVRAIAARYRQPTTFHVLEGHSHFLFGEPGAEQIAAFCEGWLRVAAPEEKRQAG